jgi:enoyl-CoA hydratase
LTRLIGPGRAARLLYSGRRVDFAEALALGLVEAGEALEWAAAVSRVSSTAVRALKAALRSSRDLPFAEAQQLMRIHREPLDASEEYADALAAFQARGPRTAAN